MTATTHSSTPAYDRIHFATMAMESGAKRLGITPQARHRRLKRQDLIHQRLMRHYDLLHTQSLDYVAEDIAETLQNWENQEWQHYITVHTSLSASPKHPVAVAISTSGGVSTSLRCASRPSGGLKVSQLLNRKKNCP